MKFHTIKMLLASALLSASVGASASTFYIGDTYNAVPGGIDTALGVLAWGTNNPFNGYIYAATDGDSDSVTFSLANAGGTATAYETSFTTVDAAATGLSLWKYDGSSLYDFVANGILYNTIGTNGTTWKVSSWLTSGDYLLRLEGPDLTHYSGTVSAVPLPAAALLFGSALLGAGALRRKQKAGDNSEMAAA